MAMSNAEKVKRYQDRKRELLKKAPDQSSKVVVRPISQSLGEFLDGTEFPFEEGLDSLGVHIDGLLGEDVQHFRSDGLGEITMPGLARLEGLAGAFLEAALELHTMLNAFKSQEARDRLAELEEQDLPDPDARRAAMTKAVELNAILVALGRSSRHEFPAIEVKEVKR